MPTDPIWRSNMQPYYAILGEIVSHFDRLDSGCMRLFASLVKSPAAEAIYLSARSFDLRLEMTRLALKKTKLSTPIEPGLKALDHIAKLSGKRNAVVHGQWIMYTPVGPLRLALPEDWQEGAALLGAYFSKHPQFQKKFHKHIYNMARLEELALEMDLAVNELFPIVNLVHAELYPELQPKPPLSPPAQPA